ncbi:MAG: thiamine-phosphate kinase [Thermodesulfobacteriota bacterium]
MDIRKLGESGLIKEIAQEISFSDPKVIMGVGDDAAVTEVESNEYLLSTVDTLIEDVHFSLYYTSASLLGRKAVTVSLSDIAAMGGTPNYILVSIAIPDKIESNFVSLLYKGIKEQADSYSVRVIGGDTLSSPDKLIVSIFMLGKVSRRQVVFRNGAKEGDKIYVTGTVGDSALGLKILKQGCHYNGLDIDKSPYRQATLAHIDPKPRVEIGKVLAERGLATAMIDISDGLLKDMRHITEESGVGANIYLSKLPLSTALKKHLVETPEDLTLPLSGGEDYELLFTSSPSLSYKVEATSRELRCPISYIGDIVSPTKGTNVIGKDGKNILIKYEGFDHFRVITQ